MNSPTIIRSYYIGIQQRNPQKVKASRGARMVAEREKVDRSGGPEEGELCAPIPRPVCVSAHLRPFLGVLSAVLRCAPLFSIL